MLSSEGSLRLFMNDWNQKNETQYSLVKPFAHFSFNACRSWSPSRFLIYCLWASNHRDWSLRPLCSNRKRCDTESFTNDWRDRDDLMHRRLSDYFISFSLLSEDFRQARSVYTIKETDLPAAQIVVIKLIFFSLSKQHWGAASWFQSFFSVFITLLALFLLLLSQLSLDEQHQHHSQLWFLCPD